MLMVNGPLEFSLDTNNTHLEGVDKNIPRDVMPETMTVWSFLSTSHAQLPIEEARSI